METEGLVEHDVLDGQRCKTRLELREEAFEAEEADGTQGMPNTMGNTAPRNGGDTVDAKEREMMTQANGGGEEVNQTDIVMTSSEDQRLGHGHGGGQRERLPQRQFWESNYKEAAIFLEEGLNNEKFTHHPRTCDDLPAYLMVHNSWFHLIDLGASLVLLALGFVEQPCKAPLCVPVQVHSSIELCVLLLVAIQVFMRIR